MEYAYLGKYENHYMEGGLGGSTAAFKGGPAGRQSITGAKASLENTVPINSDFRQ
jgi:hypothetical protein